LNCYFDWVKWLNTQAI